MTAPRMDVEVRFTPSLDELQSRVKERRDRLADMRDVYARASIYLDRWVQRNFKTEGGKVGGWLPLAAGGRRRDGRLDTSARILQDTGRLRASFLPFATRKDAGIGSDLPYAYTHEFGEDGPPQRRILPRKPEVINDVMRIVDTHVKRGLA